MHGSSIELGSRKERLDVSKIFLAYLASAGDPVMTADIAECRIDDVLYLAKAELWDLKLAENKISRGNNVDRAKTRGREINRMANYIQAIRLRSLVDKAIQWIYEDEENITKFCQEVNKQGHKVFSTKPLMDLTKAAETVQAMTYRSLGDTIPKEDGGIGTMNNIQALHLTVIEAMKNAEPVKTHVPLDLAQVREMAEAKKLAPFLDVHQALE